MKKNVGGADRTMRLVMALLLFSLYFILEGDARYFALIGFVPLMTALLRFCPAYCIFGINTGDKSKGSSCCGGGSCSTEKPEEDKSED